MGVYSCEWGGNMCGCMIPDNCALGKSVNIPYLLYMY